MRIKATPSYDRGHVHCCQANALTCFVLHHDAKDAAAEEASTSELASELDIRLRPGLKMAADIVVYDSSTTPTRPHAEHVCRRVGPTQGMWKPPNSSYTTIVLLSYYYIVVYRILLSYNTLDFSDNLYRTTILLHNTNST